MHPKVQRILPLGSGKDVKNANINLGIKRKKT
jgi:hypothetical protein